MNISLITDECSHDPFTALEFGTKWGITHYEIRYAYRWRLPISPTWACDLMASAIKSYGATVTATSPGLFKPVMRADGSKIPISMDTPDEIRRHIEELLPQCCTFAQRLGTRHITVFALPKPDAMPEGAPIPSLVIDTLGQAARKAESAGCILLLENGRGSWADTGAASRAIAQAVNSPALRLTWDPANVIHGGFQEDPVSQGYPLVQPYVGNVHVKDASFTGGKGRWEMMGEGTMNWVEQLKSLRSTNYIGCLTLEPHLQYESPMNLVQKLDMFLSRFRQLLG